MKKKLLSATVIMLPLALSACATPVLQQYMGVVEQGHVIAPIKKDQLPQKYIRQTVVYPNAYKKGTIIVDIDNRYLYYTLSELVAIRYGITVPLPQFLWYGNVHVQYKKPWPTWTPPKEMIARDPSVAPYANGMAPGVDNPLGARAIYLFEGKKDTLYRLHGTPEWWSIGQSSTSGCFRLLNEDVIDLYNRVTPGSEVIVLKPKQASQ